MLFLGFDSSTQSLTAQIIEVVGDTASLVWESALNFDRDLPQYGTRHGVSPNADPRIVEAPPQMWADALDMMMARIAASDVDLSSIAAISGSAQQHGTVYLGDAGFTRDRSPIWLDSSTEVECAEITANLGGDDAAARLTGSRVFERFAGPQIRRFWKARPEDYARTRRIHLISSFLCSELLGANAPIDAGDGSGMSLMRLSKAEWDPVALAATAPDLGAKLPAISPSDSIVGTLGRRWQERYGFPAADIVPWTGDNSSSLIGSGCVEEGTLAISLGTSDTIFGVMREPRISANGEGHVFAAPTGDFMGITVFANGSLAREHIRDQYGMNWFTFSRALHATPAGNNGGLLLPWFVPEITPHVSRPRAKRLNIEEHEAARNVRAIVEAQMMAMANHSTWMGVDVGTVYATGGASGNRDVLQIMADVFDARVFASPVRNSACLGATLRAWHAHARAGLGGAAPVSWPDVVRDLTAPDPASVVTPNPANAEVYASLRREYAAFELANTQQ
jgi:xylulokinase